MSRKNATTHTTLLRILRQCHQLSASEMADHFGIARTAWARYERGVGVGLMPTPVKAVENFFGCEERVFERVYDGAKIAHLLCEVVKQNGRMR